MLYAAKGVRALFRCLGSGDDSGEGPGRLWCQVGWKWSGVEAGVGHRVALGALCRLPMLLAITGKSGTLPQGAAGQGPSARAP